MHSVNLEIVYERSNYVVYRGNKNKDGFIIYNKNKPFNKGHTHLKSLNKCKKVIDNMISKNFPLSWSNFFIVSMLRLSDDKEFSKKLRVLHKTRLKKGKKRSYKNVPKNLQ